MVLLVFTALARVVVVVVVVVVASRRRRCVRSRRVRSFAFARNVRVRGGVTARAKRRIDGDAILSTFFDAVRRFAFPLWIDSSSMDG